MLGFSWLAMRQAQEALKNGRLEEAEQRLKRADDEGHKRVFELTAQLAAAYIERGQRHLKAGDNQAAWNDLKAAERLGGNDPALLSFRQGLNGEGISQVRTVLEAGEPARAIELIAQLKKRGIQQPDLLLLEEGAKSWLLAREQADRGEFSQALESAGRIRRLILERPAALNEFTATLEKRQQAFAPLVVGLHEAVQRKEWPEVVRISEQMLAMAPQHQEARRAKSRAWKSVELQTVHSVRPRPETAPSVNGKALEMQPRYLLWIDGVGGFLVCMGNRVTIGQATHESSADIPLFADISRLHASVTRDSEGYLLEATRPVKVNGRDVERALLRSKDCLTLGQSCQLEFTQPVALSATARLDIRSGNRLPWAVDGILLMADTLVLSPSAQAHVSMPDLDQAIILYRQKDGLGVRYGGNMSVDGVKCQERALLGPNSTVASDDFAFAIEPIGTGQGRS
jgi:tetratricopeptide (TPR) repeat protein